MNVRQMRVRCPDAKAVGAVTLNRYKLLFRGGNGSAVATIEPKRGGRVPGLLWLISPNDEASLDAYEGYPYLYRKEKIRVLYDGEKITAMVYVMNKGYPPGLPSTQYLRTIAEGYAEFGVDCDALAEAVGLSASLIPRTL
jgi:gamma-glutamylcyclotransferase (GGCT)/AIG2-like uncharacterized protein YtfP